MSYRHVCLKTNKYCKSRNIRGVLIFAISTFLILPRKYLHAKYENLHSHFIEISSIFEKYIREHIQKNKSAKIAIRNTNTFTVPSSSDIEIVCMTVNGLGRNEQSL